MPLAVEIPFEPVAHRLVQQDAGPAGAKHHIHHPRRCRHRTQIDQRDAQRFAHQPLPVLGRDQPVQRDAPAAAGIARFPAAVRFHDDRDIDPRHRPDIGRKPAFGAQDGHLLHRGREAGRDLDHARVQIAREGVDFTQKRHARGKTDARRRVYGGVKRRDLAPGRQRERAAAIADGQPHGFGGLFQGGFADIGRMGIAGDLAPHGAQAKALFGVIAGIAQPAVVKDQRFGPGAFQKQFAILGAIQRLAQDRQGAILIQMGLKRGKRNIGHADRSLREGLG